MAENSLTLTEWKQRGGFFSTAHGRLFFRIAGEGETLLLVHGFPTSSWDWHQVYEPLSERFNVIAVDMLGYGFSDKPKDIQYTTVLQAQLLQQVLRDNEIKEAHIMTFSYGVSVAQEMLRQQQVGESDLVIKSLCFMNGGLFPSSNHPNLSQRLLLGKFGWLFKYLLNKRSLRKNLTAVFSESSPPSEQLINDYWELVNHNNGRSLLPNLIQYLHERSAYMNDWEKALLNANCPIQLIFGDSDEISGVEVVKEFNSKIDSDHVHILNGVGHYPQLEMPEKVLNLYIEFLNSSFK